MFKLDSDTTAKWQTCFLSTRALYSENVFILQLTLILSTTKFSSNALRISSEYGTLSERVD